LEAPQIQLADIVRDINCYIIIITKWPPVCWCFITTHWWLVKSGAV